MGIRLRRLWQLATCYSLYVLFVLMLVYLVNQMDRFVLGVAAQQTAQSLEYGEQSCLQAETGKSEVKCRDITTKRNCTCTSNSCKWDYDGQGIEYQVLAGPVFVVVFSVAVVVMGIVAEVRQVNRPKVLAVFVTLWSLVTFLMGFTTKYWQLAVLRMSLGVFQSVCTPFCASMILDRFEKGIRGSAMSIFNWGVYFGFSLAFALKYLALNGGWRWAFRLAGMLGIILAILVFFTIKETESNHSQRLLSSKISELCHVLRMFLSPSLILLCIAGGIRNGAGLVFAYNVDSFFTQYRHANAAHYMSWIPLVGGTVGSLIGGIVSDRGEKAHGLVGRLVVLVLSQLAAAPLAFGVLWISNPTGAFLCLLMSYIIGEMWIGVCLAVVVELRKKTATSAVAVYIFAINIIGGNMVVLVPPLSSQSGWDLQYALVVLFPGMYFLSSLIFLITLCVVRRKVFKRRARSTYSVTSECNGPEPPNESHVSNIQSPEVSYSETSTDLSPDEQEPLVSSPVYVASY